MTSVPKDLMPKCLVLGGAGFMGTHLCSALLKRGYPVRGFERPVPEVLAAERTRSQIEWVYGDFVSSNDVTSAVAGCEVIFHLISTTCRKTRTKTLYTTSRRILPAP